MQRKRDGEEMTQDFISAAELLRKRPIVERKSRCRRFLLRRRHGQRVGRSHPGCHRGSSSILWPSAGHRRRGEDQSAPVTALPELDRRINAGWPAYEEALKAANVKYRATSTRVSIMAFTMTRHLVMTKRRPSWPGNARSISSTPTCGDLEVGHVSNEPSDEDSRRIIAKHRRTQCTQPSKCAPASSRRLPLSLCEQRTGHSFADREVTGLSSADFRLSGMPRRHSMEDPQPRRRLGNLRLAVTTRKIVPADRQPGTIVLTRAGCRERP